ncbi:MAG: ABC transporter permease [Clostridiales Family XIII bacterium]|jgi:ribose transport system permease protein|nr:ABC transporter permease [Clostridiales Family XIII bacterium]
MGTTVSAVRTSNKRGAFNRFAREYMIVLITIGVFISATIACTIKFGDPSTFLNMQNMVNILRASSVMGIIALGMAFVIISGNIDLSVGAQMVFVGIASFNVINGLEPHIGPYGAIVVGIIAAMAMSVALSMMCGFIVTKGVVPSFIITLGLSYIYRSLSIFVLQSGGINISTKVFQNISNTNLGIVPMPVVYFFIVFAVYLYISRYTVMGRRIFAVGSNSQATRLSGINTDWIKIQAFALLGLTVAIAAIVEGSRMNSMNSSSSGLGYDLNTIAMAVVGGIAMEGGKGNFVNVLFGIIILGMINNVLTIMGMDVYLVNAVKGGIIIAAVLLLRSRGKLN